MEIEKTNEELQHWGIKGMRWGVRRYQTADGKLTPAGRKRYNADMAKLKEKNAKLDAKIKNKSAQERAKARIEKLKAEQEAKKQALREDKDKAKAEKKAAKEAAANAKAEAAKNKKDQEIEESLKNKTAEFEAQKAQIMRSKDPQKILENAHLFTNQELNEAANRLQTEARIRDLVPEKVSKGAEVLNKTVDVTKKASDIANNAVSIYDKAAGVINVLPDSVKAKFGLEGKTLPKISTYDQDKKAAKDAADKTAKDAKDAADKAANETAAAERQAYISNLSKSEAIDNMNNLSKSEMEYLDKKFDLENKWKTGNEKVR